MKKLVLLSILFMGASAAFSQTFDWARGLTGGTNPSSFSLTTDDSGNVYNVGSFGGTMDFDPGTGVHNVTATTATDAFVSKLDSAGNFVWSRTIGRATSSTTSGQAAFTFIARDRAGNLLLSGYYSGTVDFDPGSGTSNATSTGSSDAFIMKLDPGGNLIWARQFGGTSTDAAMAITVDDNNNVIANGYFYSTADFNPGSGVFNMTSAGGEDIFVIKLSSAGSFIWAKRMGGNSIDWGHGVVTDHFGNVYSTGWFCSNADFDPGSGSYMLSTNPSAREIFVSKLDSAGNFIWAKQMGSYAAEDEGYAIALDAQCNVYTTGFFQGSGDFNPGSGSSDTCMLTAAGRTFDMYFSKLDSAGNFIWAKVVGGTAGSEGGYGISVDSFDNIYATGSFTGTVDFDPGAGTHNLTTVSATQYDAFLLKLDSSGTYQWSGSWGSRGSDLGYGIGVDRNGYIYVSGRFSDTTDFDPSSASYYINASGIFVQKFAQCLPLTPTVTISAHPGLYLSPGQTDTFTATTTGGGSSPHYQWYVNGVAVSGATSSTYHTDSLNNNDSVTCIMTSSDSCATTDTAASNVLVIHIGEGAVGPDSYREQSAVGHLLIYPNPNGGSFSVELLDRTSSKEAVVRVVDLLGREVYQSVLPAQGKGSVQLGGDVADGVYLLQVVCEGSVVTTRVSVVR